MGFSQQIYQTVQRIPPGKVATYGQIALLIGHPRASRVVGHTLARNPHGDRVPCHRVVNRLGEMAPTFAFGGAEVQRMLLAQEGVAFTHTGCVDLALYGWRPDIE